MNISIFNACPVIAALNNSNIFLKLAGVNDSSSNLFELVNMSTILTRCSVEHGTRVLTVLG